MRQSVSISLSPSLFRVLDRLAVKYKRSRSEVIQTALEEFSFRSRFEELRKVFVAKARNQGIYTDEDVFEKIS